MGFFKRIIRSQLIDVIQWLDETQDTLVHRFRLDGKEIMMGAQLTVRESQSAVFLNEGQLADVFGPGRYELQTANMPILTALRSWPHGFESPFKADVFFVNTKQFIDQKWGTTNPVMMRDSEFGMLRLRGFGAYAFRVSDPAACIREIAGVNSLYTVAEVEGLLKRTIVSGLSDTIAESGIPALDLASQYDELGALCRTRLSPRFAAYGLTLTDFVIENLSLPEDVEKALDKRTTMGVLGDMNQYTRYQAAEAIRDAAANPAGGFAGAGVGLGAGAALGQVLSGALQTPQQAPAAAPTASCPSCHAQVAAGAKFCPACGGNLQPRQAPCVRCGKPLPEGAKFCAECGAKQENACADCGKPLAAGVKFCPECGAKQP